jgi:hypothetical protein
MGQDTANDGGFDLDALEKSLGVNRTTAASGSGGAVVSNKDVFDFLSSLDGGAP